MFLLKKKKLFFILIISTIFSYRAISSDDFYSFDKQNKSCASLMYDLLGFRSRSLLPTNKREKKARLIHFNEYSRWSSKQWLNSLHEVVKFKDVNLRILPQEILVIEDFSKSEEKLIDKIFKLSKSRKYLNMGYYNEYNKLKSLYSAKGIDIDNSDIMSRNALKDISDHEVEVGAFRVIFANGQSKVAIHTSYRHSAIEPNDYIKALNGILQEKDLSDVLEIQFFHNHPHEGGPLSNGDLVNQKHLFKYFQNEGVIIPVHFYALTKRGNVTIVFHSGLSE